MIILTITHVRCSCHSWQIEKFCPGSPPLLVPRRNLEGNNLTTLSTMGGFEGFLQMRDMSVASSTAE